jgi:hypothetical protein
MISTGFPEKTIPLELEKKVIKITPLRGDAFMSELEQLLNITIKHKTVFFGQIIAAQHGSYQFSVLAEFIMPSAISHVQVTEYDNP